MYDLQNPIIRIVIQYVTFNTVSQTLQSWTTVENVFLW